MSELLNSPFAVLTCTLGIVSFNLNKANQKSIQSPNVFFLFQAGWIITFVGLCASHAFTHMISWWVVTFEFLVVFVACTVFWTNSVKVYYPVVKYKRDKCIRPTTK